MCVKDFILCTGYYSDYAVSFDESLRESGVQILLQLVVTEDIVNAY